MAVATLAVERSVIPVEVNPGLAQQVVQPRSAWNGFGVWISTGDALLNLLYRQGFRPYQGTSPQFYRAGRFHPAWVELQAA